MDLSREMNNNKMNNDNNGSTYSAVSRTSQFPISTTQEAFNL